MIEQKNRMSRINVGCGQTPTYGWKNFDNSYSLRFSKIPLLPDILYSLRFLEGSQYKFIKFARKNDIQYADATKGLPLKNETCEVIYSSHMLEHLDRNEADKFLEEAFRVLCPRGVIRIVVPDIQKLIEQYNITGDADGFVESTHMCVPRPTSLARKFKMLLVGPRHHQWMYNGNSLCLLLQKHGFVETQILPAGKTKISESGLLDLHERSVESVYVEAMKPCS